MEPEVVIVGAGPVGLSLALGLARQGRLVQVLEKEPHTAEHSRAPVIWPRTQEVLDNLGALSVLADRGILKEKLQLWDVDREKVLFEAPLSDLQNETPFPRLLILPQSDTERLLLEALQETGAQVQFSCEVTGIRQNEDGVVVRYQHEGVEMSTRAAFVAGCDGAHSTVRHLLNASFDGETYQVQAALADIELAQDDQDLRFPRFTAHPRIAIGIRISDTLWRLILPFRHSEHVTLDERVQDAAKSLFGTSVYRTEWQSEFRLHRRLSSTFCQGRVVLAGDAAHLNSPVGGQGMNAGIQDTESLTRAMLEALDNQSTSPLEAYGQQRSREIRTGVNRFTNTLTRILLVKQGRLIPLAFGFARALMSVPPMRRRILRRIAMLE